MADFWPAEKLNEGVSRGHIKLQPKRCHLPLGLTIAKDLRMTQNSTTPQNAPPLKKLSNLLVLWRFVKRYPTHLGLAMIALVIAAGSSLAIPQALRNVVDKGFGAENAASIAPYFNAMFVIAAVMAFATAMRFYFVTWIGERVVADVRTAVHAHLLTLSPEYFEENRPAEIASRLTADTTIIEQVVGTSASMALRNLLIGTGGMYMMLTIAPRLAAMLLLIIPLGLAPIVFFGRRVRNLSRSSQDKVADVGAMADEALGAIRIVQGYTQEPREVKRFAEAVESAFQVARKRFSTRAIMTAIIILLIFSMIIFMLRDGAQDVIEGRMSGGAMAQFVLLAGLVAGAFGALTEVFGDVMRAAGAAGRLTELLNTPSKIQPPLNPVPMPVPARGAVTFENVTFRYPSKPDWAALNGFSVDIKPGETVAVVGPSGAGKTTLFQLLQRFYDPQQGRILIDGIALTDAHPRELRTRIAVVPQETVIFAATAFENIMYGKPDATEAQVWDAARSANITDVLKDLPDGIHSYLGEAGVRLSGGQRQRLAIARAILRDAPILLLDEATSALDSENEQLVQAALDKLMLGRTTLIIAHRLATVLNADRILVMDKGEIIAQGTHAQLIAGGGLYARLAALQFQGAEAV